MNSLLTAVSNCTACSAFLPHGCRPVLTANTSSKILLIGQAPGKKVHETGIPWDDKSGQTLRYWLGVKEATFYDPHIFALMPMGFCYPGKGKSGDLPPRSECAPLWHALLLQHMKEIELTVLIGQYAQQYYLGKRVNETLTATVQAFKKYLPDYFPLPHPSPRNNIWQTRNPWFGNEVVPALQKKVKKILGNR